ncbi:MAG: hypothetical protein P1P74_09590 [Desulfuromonadales bacterium]|nr:hypothetical protein [Desulfuromonadales bacterium]MDT8423498.1 hypothetical protein [Desulfuromonadales bacterium]
MRMLIAMLLMAAVLSGCATTTAQTSNAGPQPVLSKGEDFHVYENHGRLFVVGSQESLEKFKASGHLPYTRTLTGAGPKGETVVFEVDKKNPEETDRLQKEFAHIPFMVDSNAQDFFVYKKGERFYVIGNQKTNETFMASGHLPYTKTILGAGPLGETVVFEVDKKNPKVTDRLVQTYKN